ncbi:MAG: hypothetical protein ACYTAF_10225 [Planctomycetota bacterium]|jgi:aspartate aminotransferase
MMTEFTRTLKRLLPGVIISKPDASLYSVIDVRGIVRPGFNAMDFVLYCAQKGKVRTGGRNLTLLVAPMSGFYMNKKNPGGTMMRIAYVETPANMKLVAPLFAQLLRKYESGRSGATGRGQAAGS